MEVFKTRICSQHRYRILSRTPFAIVRSRIVLQTEYMIHLLLHNSHKRIHPCEYRSYRNGFVWHDLSENDLIHPTHGTEYVLKGSELLRASISFRYPEKPRTLLEALPEAKLSVGENCTFPPAATRRRNRSWSSFDEPQEYRVYSGELGGKSAAADASTQTGDGRRGGEEEGGGATVMELSRGETTPSSISSSEVIIGGGMSGGSRAVDVSGEIGDRTVGKEYISGRMKASRVLMQLVSCGSVSVRSRGL